MNEGGPLETRAMANPMYLHTGDPGLGGGGTYSGTNTQPTLQQYENIFGPAARDIKLDQQRHKRHQRWHLPDALKGSNQYLTDRIDGLITDATNSPFTRNILPYVYLENPDQKLKWNVYSFDEGIASRVPYEAAARVLPQTKRSFAGYTVRQGLAIAMEHNFMVSAAGRENFKNQLTQLVGSIQLTNDLDVHVALLSAPSYQRHMNDKYYDTSKTTSQACRQYVDLFGIMQKVPNALDILIEDAKNHLKTWGSAPPSFLMCNGALTTQLTMLPEKTNYLTNGPDGARRLAQGPDLPSYRGLSIINTRKFSMDAGTAPRDLLRRRVRVAEYYRIPYKDGVEKCSYEFYDQSRDTMFKLSYEKLLKMAGWVDKKQSEQQDSDNPSQTQQQELKNPEQAAQPNSEKTTAQDERYDILILRPNIEHEMLGVIMGRGGTQELGATFWGQTELSCYDDAQHGIWGMSYKYHERAIVTNERNLIRVYDVAFDGYNGGMDQRYVNWHDPDSIQAFKDATWERTRPYNGPSMLVMALPVDEAYSDKTWPNPIVYHPSVEGNASVSPEKDNAPSDVAHHMIFHADCTDACCSDDQIKGFSEYMQRLGMQHWVTIDQCNRPAGDCCIGNETSTSIYAFEGTMGTYDDQGHLLHKIQGSGHLGPSYVGVASVREGRGVMNPAAMPTLHRMI